MKDQAKRPSFYSDLTSECCRIANSGNTFPIEIQLGTFYYTELVRWIQQNGSVTFVSCDHSVVLTINNILFKMNPNLPPQSFAILFSYF